MTREEAIKTLMSATVWTDDERKALGILIPELRESEDERMRQLIYSSIKNDMPIASPKNKELALSWLEKQKEQSKEELVYRLNGLMQEYVKEGKDEAEKEHRFKCYQLFWDALEDADFFGQKEQKPAWSEEDEKKLGKCIDAVSGYYSPEDKQELKNWLKSLRPQPKQEVPADTEVLTAKLVNLLKSYRIGEVTATGLANRIADTYGTQRYLDGLCDGKKGEWKPSEEQMEALLEAMQETRPGWLFNRQLVSLYDDLKKL